MAAFDSPLADPASWTLTAEARTLPAECRYPGRTAWGVRGVRAAGGAVRSPALAAVRVHGDGAGGSVVALEPVPFPIRRVIERLAFGLPTFFVALPAVPPASVMVTAGGLAAGGATIATVTDAWVGVLGQDETPLDAAAWSAALLAALAGGGGTTAAWQPFHDAVNAAARPVLLLDHRSRPLSGVGVRVAAPIGTRQAALDPVDAGDLQAAFTRAGHDDVFGGSAAVTIELVAPAGTAPVDRWVRVDDGTASQGTVSLTPTARHAAVTDLQRWFAPQQVSLPAGSPDGPSLQHFTTGNRVDYLIDGKATYARLVDELVRIRDEGGGFHLAGWDLHHDFDLREPLPEAPDKDVTLEELVKDLSAAGRQTRFLATEFLQGLSASALPGGAVLTLALILETIAVLDDQGVKAVETDLAGGIVGAIAVIGATALAAYLVETDGSILEPSKAAIDALNAIADEHAVARFDAYPVTTADNPLAGGLGTWFGSLNRFGVFHQKIAVAERAGRLVAFVGGVDLNPNRVDDPDHAATAPYHDMHLRVEGPASIDVARTFDQRWRRAQPGVAPAFTVPTSQADAGGDIVQVARTYFRTTDTSRAFTFAPDGDFTLRETLLRAIRSAREYIYIEDQYFTPPHVYRDALIEAVATQGIERLVIVLPTVTEQPFGDLERRQFAQQLRDADPTPDKRVVRVGGLLPRPRLPEFERNASGGKCFVHSAVPAAGTANQAIVLSPEAQVPEPPFWLAVEGELMLAIRVAAALPAPAESTKAVQVLRGADLGIGTEPVAHEAGAPATVVSLNGIYVHSKMMIVDDLFVSVGSANMNRRGLAHDGEINVFTVPETLRRDRANLARRLRIALWGEHLGLPPTAAEALLADPIAGSGLFDRRWLAGNRFIPLDFLPVTPAFDLPPGDTWVTFVLKLTFGTFAVADYPNLFDTVIDPTTDVT